MVSLEELQSSKALSKRTLVKPRGNDARLVASHGVGHITKVADKDTAKPGTLQPSISLQALVSAKRGLHTAFDLKSTPTTATTQLDDEGDDVLPTFTRRKELFERQKHKSSSPLPTTATVRVGAGDEVKAFVVDLKTLRTSPLFRDELIDGGEAGELSLRGHLPSTFQLFLDFCQQPLEPVEYQPGRYSNEPWVTTSAAACILATALRARRFEKYALSQFVQNCAVMVTGPWKLIQDSTASGSALSKFSAHWVAWNASFTPGSKHEYMNLEAADLAAGVTSETRDPRIFDLEHWYSLCGDDLNSLCEHDPIRRRRQRLLQQRKANPPLAEWGANRERRAQRKS